MYLSHHVALDLVSGTFFGASNAYIVDMRKLSPEDVDTFNEGTDSDRRELAERYGIDLEHLSPPVTTRPDDTGVAELHARQERASIDSQALDAVAALLNAETWSSDHLNTVADMVRSTGRTITDI